MLRNAHSCISLIKLRSRISLKHPDVPGNYTPCKISWLLSSPFMFWWPGDQLRDRLFSVSVRVSKSNSSSSVLAHVSELFIQADHQIFSIVTKYQNVTSFVYFCVFITNSPLLVNYLLSRYTLWLCVSNAMLVSSNAQFLNFYPDGPHCNKNDCHLFF